MQLPVTHLTFVPGQSLSAPHTMLEQSGSPLTLPLELASLVQQPAQFLTGAPPSSGVMMVRPAFSTTKHAVAGAVQGRDGVGATSHVAPLSPSYEHRRFFASVKDLAPVPLLVSLLHANANASTKATPKTASAFLMVDAA